MLNTSFVPYGLVRFGDLCPWWTVSRDVIALSFPRIQQTVCWIHVCTYLLSVAELFFLEKDVKVIDVTRSYLYMMALTCRNTCIGTTTKMLITR
jgi:hypothetical protein